MNRKLLDIFFFISFLLVLSMVLKCSNSESKNRKINFNANWKFFRGEFNTNIVNDEKFDDKNWETVHLPHAPEKTLMHHPWPLKNWHGENWYRKEFLLGENLKNKKIIFEFEGADQVAKVWVNGKELASHSGSFTPFFVDATDVVRFGNNTNRIIVGVNNFPDRDIPVYGNWISYGGIYRDVYLHIMDRLHITYAINAHKIAGGGIFVTYPFVTDSLAEVIIQTHVKNETDVDVECGLKSSLLNNENQIVASIFTEQVIAVKNDYTFIQRIKATNPKLWHPNQPNLYTLVSEVYNKDKLVDVRRTRIGIRNIRFSKDKGFSINGKHLKFMGTNRVQDYPYIAWAFSNEAQKRDARLLRQGGFQYIRLSHNLQDPSFLDACDELGVLVMACIPGFQYVGGEKFLQHSYQDMRDLIRRDRNHPSIILWELSLNETNFDSTFAKKAMETGHEEFPGDQCFISGWKFENIYDVYIRASQHGARKYSGETPLVISEYGHWDYGEGNSTSDVNRKDGEEAMLIQARNHQESLNANRAMPFLCGDGLWVGIDFQIFPSGVIDYFRLPKFSFYFYQSQRDPYLKFENVNSGPMIFIANYWTENSPREVKVFSNCDSVQLLINGEAIATQTPDIDSISNYLLHPPFTFKNVKWQSGELKAVGFLNGKQNVEYVRNTPGKAYALEIEFSIKTNPAADGEDMLFAYAKIVDKNGTIVPRADSWIDFKIQGPAILESPNKIQTEAGIASALIRVTNDPGGITVQAKTSGLINGKRTIFSLASR